MNTRTRAKAAATSQTRAEQMQRDAAERKPQEDRKRTDCYRPMLRQRAINIQMLAVELREVLDAAEVIDTRRLTEELARIEANLARQVERIAEEAGLTVVEPEGEPEVVGAGEMNLWDFRQDNARVMRESAERRERTTELRAVLLKPRAAQS